MEAAFRSEVWTLRVAEQQRKLGVALASAERPSESGAVGTLSLGGALAAIQTVPFVLNAVSDAGKFFRTDRSVSLFDSGEEAQRLLEHLLEQHASAQEPKRTVQRLNVISGDIVKEAQALLKTTGALRSLHDRATQQLGELQRMSEVAARPPSTGAAAPPSPEGLAILRDEIAAARALLDALDAGKAPEAFWAQVLGQAKRERLRDQHRVQVVVKAQTVQMLEKRVWRSDKLLGAAEVQIEVRVTDSKGTLKFSDVMLYVAGTRNAFDPTIAKLWKASDK